MNFNFNEQPEYDLNTSLAEEMINLYGVLTKFLVVEKINTDDTVFGDYSHLKSDSTKIHDIYMIPENTEDWDQGEYEFGGFALLSTNNVNLFAAKSSFDGIADIGEITGNLLVFPNNKVMEITHTDATVPGVNNLFTYKDQKSVYQLTCKPYSFKSTSELNAQDISVDDGVPYETLDHYFDELTQEADTQDAEISSDPTVSTVDDSQEPNVKKSEPIVDKSVDSVWGDFD